MRTSAPTETPLSELSDAAARILTDLGVTAKANCGLLIDCSRSMSDEFGLDTHQRPKPGAVNQVRRAVTAYLALAQHLDPNGVAQGGFFSEGARLGEEINLDNHAEWVERNQLPAHEMLGTDMAAGLKMMLAAIAKEMGVSTIAELALFTHPANHDQVHVDPMVSDTPYQLALITDGEPEDVVAVENLLRAMSWAPIQVLVIYVSNQRAGLDVLHSLTRIPGRLTDNVKLVELGHGGLAKVSDEALLRAFAEGLPAFFEQNKRHGLVA